MNPYTYLNLSSKEASSIAKRFFDRLDINKKGEQANNEISNFIKGINKSVGGKDKNVFSEVQGFINHHDYNKDGKLTVGDLELVAKKYFCGSKSIPK